MTGARIPPRRPQRGRRWEVALLDVDPDLAESLTPDEEPIARRRLLATVAVANVGIWEPSRFADGAGLGLLVLEGAAVRCVSLGRRTAGELVGVGDILRPWQDDGDHIAYPVTSSWRVIEPLELAVLDAAASERLMHHPTVVHRLAERSLARARRLAGQLAIAQLSGVDDRVHVALWHLADRYGRVCPDGVKVDIALTHELLGLLVGARRPSVTSGLARLADRGLVDSTRSGWLLRGPPPRTVGVGGVATPPE